MAGIVPCLLLTVVYCSVLALWCALKPEVGPRGPSHPWPARLASLSEITTLFTDMALPPDLMRKCEAWGTGVQVTG